MGLSPQQRAEAKEIARELGRIARSGEVLAGSITERMKQCGRTGCRCMADPPRPHGPYFQWTRKVRQKTMGRWLSAEQRDVYTRWIDNDRRLRELVNRLEAIGESVVERDPRTGSRR